MFRISNSKRTVQCENASTPRRHRPGKRPQVWAPAADTVELLRENHCWSMEQDGAGWWHNDQCVLHPGDHYFFRLDAGPLLADPRSAWQPDGVKGPSCVVGHSDFQWTDKHWQAKPLAAALIYELHVGTFTPEGTFEAVIERLEHLVDLGVTHVELMPVAEFLGEYGWGYDGVFPFAPHHAYGGPVGLKRLVNACHEAGLGILLDVVYNHLGPSGNCLPSFGPYFTTSHTTPWGDAINFDGPHSDEVRRYFCDNALMWLRDYHFDGLRLDAVHAIVDTSAVPFLEQLATEVDALKATLGRHLVLIAESDLNDPRVVRSWELGGLGLDAQWSDDIHHALHTALTNERAGYYSDFGTLEDLATSMTRPFVYAGRHSPFRGRRHGRAPIGLSAHKFVAFIQNHDQLGNRAKGERLAHLVDMDRAKIAAALIMLSPYVPMLFQGEEWGASSPFRYFVDFQAEPNLAAAVAKGRQQEFAGFGWQASDVPNPTQPEAFQVSKLNWDEIAAPYHTEMLNWHQQLNKLRCRISAFTDGRLDLLEATANEQQRWIIIERDNVVIVCNLADDLQGIPISRPATYVLLASKDPPAISQDRIRMAGNSVVVITDKPTLAATMMKDKAT